MCEPQIQEVKKMSDKEFDQLRVNIFKQKDRIQAIKNLKNLIAGYSYEASCYIGVGTSTEQCHIHLLAFQSLLSNEIVQVNQRNMFVEEFCGLLEKNELRMSADLEKMEAQLEE